jgi:hypothetical protein
MIKLKVPSVFDYYAPTGGGSKIADFMTKKTVTQPVIKIPEQLNIVKSTANTSCLPNTLNNSKPDNTWMYIVGGIMILAIGILIHERYKERNEREEMNDKSN